MKVKIPLMKNCRIDYKTFNECTWSALVDYTDSENEKILYFKSGICTIKDVYSEFKFSVNSYLPIDNSPYCILTAMINKIDGALYQF